MSVEPTGTIVLLFTDIEGSTRLWELDPAAMSAALARHDALLRRTIEAHGGRVFKTVGDAFHAAFDRAPAALAAALAAQREIQSEPGPAGLELLVRMAIHAGAVEARGGDYFGRPLNRVARLLAIGHGGQILLSRTAVERMGDDVPAAAALRDLGFHRLKDLDRPEQVYQVVAPTLHADFPPLRSLNAERHNLPLQLTSFIGRERELEELGGRLDATRLLTLTGAGGSGKTRLALQLAAEQVEALEDGVWFVDLAPLSDPALVAQTTAFVLGLKDQAGRSPEEVLVDHLRSRSLLLMLDNCEHVVAACAALSERLLRSCPGLRILATSREVLGVAGELVWPVPSLSAPDPERLPEGSAAAALAEFEAVRLFVDRARLAQPAFVVTAANAPAVARICQQLDGIPLALELAAARVKVMTVQQIAARLADRFRLLTDGGRTAIPRHQTLRTAIDWSYDLLAETERGLLGRLSVFAGGWPLEAAEALGAGGLVAGDDVLDLLSHLVDKSLVIVGPGVGGEARYRLLETIRHYAGERLEEAGEAATVRDLHLGWFLTLAERADPELSGHHPGPWLARLEQEHDNLRAALEWSRGSERRAEAGLRLAGSLYLFWARRGYLREGSRWLESMFAAGGDVDPGWRARALHAAGVLAWRQGDHARARPFLEESLGLRRELAVPLDLAVTLYMLGVVLGAQNDTDDRSRAGVCFEESLSLAREIDDKTLIGQNLNSLGELARIADELGPARELYEQALEIHRGEHNPHAAYSLSNLGLVAFAQGDVDAAGAYFAEGLTVSRAGGDKGMVVTGLEGLAGVHAVRGRAELAARLLGAAEARRAAIHQPVQANDRADYERFVAAARSRLDEASLAAAWEAGAQLSLKEAADLALAGLEADHP